MRFPWQKKKAPPRRRKAKPRPASGEAEERKRRREIAALFDDAGRAVAKAAKELRRL